MARSRRNTKRNAPAKALNLDANKLRVKITFAKSSSPYFKTAVQLARSLPGYKCAGDGGHQTHVVDLQPNLDDVQLWERVTKV